MPYKNKYNLKNLQEKENIVIFRLKNTGLMMKIFSTSNVLSESKEYYPLGHYITYSSSFSHLSTYVLFIFLIYQ